MQPRLIVEQKLTAFVNKYHVYDTTDDGQKNNLIAFAQQKRLAFKEKVTFYSDEQKTTPVFSFQAEKALDVHGRYFVKDLQDKTIGTFQKVFKKSLLNSTWHVLNNDKPVVTISESNRTYAVVRRMIGFIPIVGEFAEIILAFMRYHFVFVDTDGQIVGTYKKTRRFYDHYELSMTDKAYGMQDQSTWAAIAVALDALQDR